MPHLYLRDKTRNDRPVIESPRPPRLKITSLEAAGRLEERGPTRRCG
jgi:hypothetical protein